MEADDAPATRGDFAGLSGDIRGLIRLVAATVVPMAGNRQEVNIQPPQDPAKGERLLWCMGVLVLFMVLVTSVAVVAAFFQGMRVTDLRGDMQTERIERKLHEQWAAQEANTMRTFAKTGVLAPMQPRPVYKPSENPK